MWQNEKIDRLDSTDLKDVSSKDYLNFYPHAHTFQSKSLEPPYITYQVTDLETLIVVLKSALQKLDTLLHSPPVDSPAMTTSLYFLKCFPL